MSLQRDCRSNGQSNATPHDRSPLSRSGNLAKNRSARGLQRAGRRGMALHQRAEIEIWDFAVFDDPASSHHDAIGAVRAAQHKGGQWIAAAREAQLVELE